MNEVPHAKWNEITQRAEMQLLQLAMEQGQQFKLIRVDSVVEQFFVGHQFFINGQFQTATGEQIECTYELFKASASDDFEDNNLYCGENEYRWSVKQMASKAAALLNRQIVAMAIANFVLFRYQLFRT